MSKVYERGMALAVAAAMLSVQAGCLKKSGSNQKSINLSSGDRVLVDEIVLIEGGTAESTQADMPVVEAVNKATGVCFLNLPRVEGVDPDTVEGRTAYKDDAAARIVGAEQGLFANQYPIALGAFWAGIDASPELAGLRGQAKESQAKQVAAAEEVVKKAGARWGVVGTGVAAGAGLGAGVLLAINTSNSATQGVLAAAVETGASATVPVAPAAGAGAAAGSGAPKKAIVAMTQVGDLVDSTRNALKNNGSVLAEAIRTGNPKGIDLKSVRLRQLELLRSHRALKNLRVEGTERLDSAMWERIKNSYDKEVMTGKTQLEKLALKEGFIKKWKRNLGFGNPGGRSLTETLAKAKARNVSKGERPDPQKVIQAAKDNAAEAMSAVKNKSAAAMMSARSSKLGSICWSGGGDNRAKLGRATGCAAVTLMAAVGLKALVDATFGGGKTASGGAPAAPGNMATMPANLPPENGAFTADGTFQTREDALLSDPAFADAVASTSQVSAIQLTLSTAEQDAAVMKMVANLGASPNGPTCQERLFPSPPNPADPGADASTSDPSFPPIQDVSAPTPANAPANSPTDAPGNAPASGPGAVPANASSGTMGNVGPSTSSKIPAAGNTVPLGSAALGNAPANSSVPPAGNAPANTSGAGNAPANSTAPTNGL